MFMVQELMQDKANPLVETLVRVLGAQKACTCSFWRNGEAAVRACGGGRERSR